MGQSTDAYLYYGFDLYDSEGSIEDDGQEMPPWWNDDSEDGTYGGWEKEYLRRKGLADPFAGAPSYDPEYSEWKVSIDPETGKTREALIDEYYDKKKELLGDVEIDTHCSGEYPIYFVTYKPWQLRAWRGESKKVPPFPRDSVVVDAAVQEFCEFLELPFRQPEWRLASYVG